MPYLPEWTKGLDDHEAQRLETTLQNSRFLLNTLAEIINRKIAEKQRVPTNDYDSPSWAYKAADREGAIRALQDILLLTKENPIKGTK